MADKKLRVYTSPSAFPNPQRLGLFALEKGIKDELEEVIYGMSPGGDQRKWPHLKMNPWGETPTLTLADGGYLAETAGIVRSWTSLTRDARSRARRRSSRGKMRYGTIASGCISCTVSSPCFTLCTLASASRSN